MLRRPHIVILSFLCLFAFSTTAQQRAIRPTQKASPTPVRQALIIGNSTYDHTSPLRNPTNDAQAISQTLNRLGFEVETLTDVNQREMEQVLNPMRYELLTREKQEGYLNSRKSMSSSCYYTLLGEESHVYMMLLEKEFSIRHKSLLVTFNSKGYYRE